MNGTIMERIEKITSRFSVGRKESTTPTLNLPNDWLTIHIPYERREFSLAQREAVRGLRGWQPRGKVASRTSMEELSLAEQIGRLVELGHDHDQETAIHIDRGNFPLKRAKDDWYGEVRNERAVESINRILDAFPDEQIEITRVGDFEMGGTPEDRNDAPK